MVEPMVSCEVEQLSLDFDRSAVQRWTVSLVPMLYGNMLLQRHVLKLVSTILVKYAYD